MIKPSAQFIRNLDVFFLVLNSNNKRAQFQFNSWKKITTLNNLKFLRSKTLNKSKLSLSQHYSKYKDDYSHIKKYIKLKSR